MVASRNPLPAKATTPWMPLGGAACADGAAAAEGGALLQLRVAALRDLARDAAGAQSIGECLRVAARSLDKSELDLPFLLFYAIDDTRKTARLVAYTSIVPGAPASPDRVDLGAEGGWPFAEAIAAGRPLLVNDLSRRFGDLPAGQTAAHDAYVLPIQCGTMAATAMAVVGASSRAKSSEPDETFATLFAVGLGHAVANATAVDMERRRKETERDIERARTTFFANVSHEFRTPLTLMLGPIEEELAELDEPLPPGRLARLSVAHRNSLRLLRFVNTLLDFSHIEAGHIHASFEPLDLVAVTESLATSFRAPIESAGLRLSTRLEALPEPVYVDREMWTNIVLNLLSNALKHTFRGGITLSLFASDESKDHVELRVDDTGIGIPQKELPRLFQRFHRIKGSRSRSDEGAGIGLALVRALVTMHGGDVSVVSREGLGSSFRVRLRLGSAHLPADRIVSAPSAADKDDAHVSGYVEEALRWTKESDGPAADPDLDIRDAHEVAATGVRSRILLADNNRDMRNYVTRLLQRSHDVEAVADGEAALAAALANPPDLIVLDAMLPGRNGFELLRELRTAERTSLIPVVLLSARAGEDAALEGLEAGAEDYLVKPFSGKALLARVRSSLALAKRRKESADKLREANKELEAFSYSVSHDLRAPLRAIDGFSKVLVSDYSSVLDDQGKKYLERVRAATQRMAQLIDDLLALSRITRTALNRGRVDLTDISRRILAELAARDPHRVVECVIAEGLVAQGDVQLVMVMLENLLGNAWKFTSKREAARIEVASETKKGETIFLVRDNGAGFNMEYANKLFAPFQRLHSASEFQGTGVGLATVNRVVTRHGGKIWARSEPDRGATFFFTLGDTQ